ncbi:hypothetical protein BC830DRAFT_1147286 [Chytriomyces sp. MP71]|nr:hypothetical protein BC830DRAFT_1147286 [Chytriomyces sp. MP71]
MKVWPCSRVLVSEFVRLSCSGTVPLLSAHSGRHNYAAKTMISAKLWCLSRSLSLKTLTMAMGWFRRRAAAS